MTDNEKLIDEVRNHGEFENRGWMIETIDRLTDALEAAEKAHTPTDDEREALAKGWDEGRRTALLEARTYAYPLFTDRGNPYRTEVPDPGTEDVAAEHQRHADARRSEPMTLLSHGEPQGEPSDAQVDSERRAAYRREHRAELMRQERAALRAAHSVTEQGGRS